MARMIQLEPNKTYATEENAIKAVEKKIPADLYPDLRYFIMQTKEGRFFPVFIGMKALEYQVHFLFNVVA